MLNQYENFGDCSADHGQVWIKNDGGDDFAPVVEIMSGADIGLADNQYMIQRGSIYFSPDNWDMILGHLDWRSRDRIGPPEFLEIAYGFYSYQGFDRDTFGGFEIVQVGRVLDDWTARGTTCDNPDVILHGNASIEKYIAENYIC